MHLVLVMLVVFLTPSRADTVNRKVLSSLVASNKYAVIFDAGSSGSRVHVFCFDSQMDLVPVAGGLELFVQTKPGLSSYAKNPQAAANSLVSLLDKAEAVVPKKLQPKTPVRVGATAGLRLLGNDTSGKILQAVRDLLRKRSTLKFEADDVTVLPGSKEGSYMWVTVNYLLGNLGKKYANTVGIIDLGGGSVQMAYAISETDAANAPKVSNGEDPYITEMQLKGTKYHIYVHSYLNYGLQAARVVILKASKYSHHPCILGGYDGSYTYGGKEYKASALPSGANLRNCRRVVFKSLNVSESCKYKKCTFGGVWNGGGGDGQKNLFVASFFFDRAVQVGLIDSNATVAKVYPSDFNKAAQRACKLKYKDVKSTYPAVYEDSWPYICMDLVYQYTLLVFGFGIHPQQEITLVQEIKYRDSSVETAWPLGSAIDAVSSST